MGEIGVDFNVHRIGRMEFRFHEEKASVEDI
jgi:hypothetical protein